MAKIELYIEATSCGWKKTFCVQMDKPIIDLNDLTHIIQNDVFKDPTGIAKKFLEFYGININFIRTKSREEAIRSKRQELCYFLYTYSLMQDSDIGDLVGVHHGTVNHGIKIVMDDMKFKKGYSEHINKIRGFIGLENIVRDRPRGKTYTKKYDYGGNDC